MNSRDKGKKGELAVRHLLEDRDWTVDSTRCGVQTDDMIGVDPTGRAWSVEVKRTKLTNWPSYSAQAKRQAKARKLPWMLVVHIHGTSSHIVLRQGKTPVVWGEKAKGGE